MKSVSIILFMIYTFREPKYMMIQDTYRRAEESISCGQEQDHCSNKHHIYASCQGSLKIKKKIISNSQVDDTWKIFTRGKIRQEIKQ